MRKSQFDIITKAEPWRNAGHIEGVPLASTWAKLGGGHETFCPLCGAIHTHSDVSGAVLNEERSAHCLLRSDAILKGYFLKLLPSLMPPEARRAARAWSTVHRATGYKYTADQLIAQARQKFSAEELAS
jgi:hypothetical protein